MFLVIGIIDCIYGFLQRQADADKTYVVEKQSKSHHRNAAEKKQEKKEKKDKKKKKRKTENEIDLDHHQQYQQQYQKPQPTSNFQCLGPQCTEASRINSK